MQILKYDPDGNLILSKKTMAHNHDFNRPRIVRATINQIVTFITEGEFFNSRTSIEKDKLYLPGRVGEDAVIDVYEAESAEYLCSFNAPNYACSFIMNDRMYQPLDTTVVFYSIER